MTDREKIKLGVSLGAGVLALLAAAPANCQAGAEQSAGSRMVVSLPGPEAGAHAGSGEVVRAIDDPYTGNHWLLERDPNHPGGPGRLVLLPRTTSADGHNDESKDGKAPGVTLAAALAALTPVIRSGDRLVVEETTAVVEARLEAVALGPAVQGADFEVRLQIGGKVVRAVALGPGRAVFADQIGARP